MIPPPLPRPLSPFPAINPHIVKAGTILHRTHARAFRPAQFNPCQGQPTRFAPFDDATGTCVATLYAATNREAAASESIFHDIDPAAAFKTVRLDVVEARSVSRIAPRRDLRLVGLFTPDLGAWKLQRSQLIDTPKAAYAQTALWAQAIHRAHADIDGLIWTSRQCDPERCVVLFADRIAESAFDVLERKEVAADAALLLELRGFGLRAGITLVS
ncbi:MAG TPA: RES family NAD+ phosphorylase [Acetobacteraceae bacterium]